MSDDLKEQVRQFWDQGSCGTQVATGPKFSREYFEQIEAHRYRIEPEIHSFAQFTRAHGKRILEVGIGAGTDFLQWVRAGADAYGVDLTREAIENVRHRLEVYGLAANIRQSDGEHLPFDDASFDLVYSWGVIHHSPDTPQALDEIVRVLRPGGLGKVMVYNRHSISAIRHWIGHVLKHKRPWHSLSHAIWRQVESIGTKAYTPREWRAILAARPVENVRVWSARTFWDGHDPAGNWKEWAKMAASIAAGTLAGWRNAGWFLMSEFTKR